jgi:hypothetical protein
LAIHNILRFILEDAINVVSQSDYFKNAEQTDSLYLNSQNLLDSLRFAKQKKLNAQEIPCHLKKILKD